MSIAAVVGHDGFLLDRIGTHVLGFEGRGHVEWFEGNFEDYEANKIRRLRPDAVEAKRIKYKKCARQNLDRLAFLTRSQTSSRSPQEQEDGR